MAKASLIGLITQGPELQHSAKGEPYVRFSVAEYVGFGSQRHTQFVDVWAWGYMAQRLAKCTLSNGDFIFLSGTLELEEFTKKDGITKDKRLKLRLDDWAPVPQKRETVRPVQNETEVFQSPPNRSTVTGRNCRNNAGAAEEEPHQMIQK